MSVEEWIQNYDTYDNIYESALQCLKTDTLSEGGFICELKGDDLIFKNISTEMFLDNYKSGIIDKIIQTKTPLIASGIVLPFFKKVNSFFGIPIGNKEQILGIIGLYNGEYSLEYYRRYCPLLVILRLEFEKNTLNIHTETKSKDLFLANMSHEIRTPLNGVIGYTQLLLQTEATEKQQQYIHLINKCSLGLARIINDILDFSKLSSGKMLLVPTITSITEVMEFTVETLVPRIQEKNHTVNVIIDDNIPSYILVDRQKLVQILINLLSNAVKFTDYNGLIEIKISLSKYEMSRQIQITVSDNGIGITKGNQKKLFRSFTQFDNTLSKSYQGTGLGLAIVKKLVTLMKGKISFDSTYGKGTQFTFTFNYQTINESQLVINKEYKGRSVLVISDNNETRLLLIDKLTQIGLRPIPSSNIEEASRLLLNFSYDFEMCITDLDIAKQLQSHLPLIPVVYYGIKGEYTFQTLELIKMTEVINAAFTESRYIKKKDSLKVNQRLRILIAEDNPDNQNLLVQMLESLDYRQITTVNDGVEAIQILQIKEFDVILLDLKMPRMNGFQVMDYLKKVNNRIKVIPVSASVLEEDQLQCQKYGVKTFLQKPLILKDLQQALFI